MKKKISGLVLGLALLLTACGGTPTATPSPAPQPTNSPIPPAVTTTAPNRAVNTTVAAQGQAATVATSSSDLLKVRPEKEVVKSFTDLQNRNIKLVYGRGNGRGGDYGWAHIIGKHFQGIWYDGGTITTFPQAVGAKTPEAVLDLVGKTFQDKTPDDAGNGRRSYVYAVPGTNKDIFSVVGSDGTIITSYPVPHGSKDENS